MRWALPYRDKNRQFKIHINRIIFSLKDLLQPRIARHWSPEFLTPERPGMYDYKDLSKVPCLDKWLVASESAQRLIEINDLVPRSVAKLSGDNPQRVMKESPLKLINNFVDHIKRVPVLNL